MYTWFSRIQLIVFFLLLPVLALRAQPVKEPATTNASWIAPYEPFRIAGNLYYVGTAELACYLITTSKGHLLINTGLASSASQIKNNIQALGFHFSDIKILLTTQAHHDHVGAMAAIKKETGAQLMVNAADAAALADGGSSDYALGGSGSTFQPVKADRLLHDGDTVRLGEMKIVMLHHPGHTKGSSSYVFAVRDDQHAYRVLIANMPTIVTTRRFSTITSYPTVAQDFAYTLKALQNITFDLWLTSHASQFNLHEKHKPGEQYNPHAFKDNKGYKAILSELQEAYDQKMRAEKAPTRASE